MWKINRVKNWGKKDQKLIKKVIFFKFTSYPPLCDEFMGEGGAKKLPSV